MSSKLHVAGVTGGRRLKFAAKMVSFICNACGQTVKKAQVERHYQNDCRNCDVLSCIDCGKDFHGDEYVAHTSCITEAEKYQGKLYKPKDKQNKGEHKQQEWLKVIKSSYNVVFRIQLGALFLLIYLPQVVHPRLFNLQWVFKPLSHIHEFSYGRSRFWNF